MNSKLCAVLGAAIATLTLDTSFAQSPAPVGAGTGTQTTAAETNNASMQATMKSLRETKAANEQILKKQQTTLEALDELQKAAEQIKIFSKRG